MRGHSPDVAGVMARLEGARTKPSTSTLERFARATDTRLCIGFKPEQARA